MRFSRVIGLILGASLGVGGGALAHFVVPESPIVRGLFVGERHVPDDVHPAVWLSERRDRARSRIVYLRFDDEVIETTLGELGVQIDVQATIDEAERIGHEGSMFRRLREAREARQGAIDLPLVWWVDETRARLTLEKLAPRLARPPTDARLDLAARAKIPDIPGRTLDVDATIEVIAASRHTEEETIFLITREVRAAVTLLDLVQVEVSRVVSTFETTFATYGSGVGRSKNIRTAASKLDGLVLMPGQILSFNDRVGPRTLEAGFALAPEIQGDELQTGVGGGTCQVSSTLYAAALFGAMGIVDRQGHSRPSSYTKLGLDATVSYPTTDLKIQNTLPFPIMIHAYLPKPTAIRVELLGGDPIAKVDYTFGIGGTEDFVRRIHVKPHLPPGKRIRRQKGTRGYDVTSIVKVQYLDGRVEERRYFSGYRPAPEVFWVAPGYDEAELPPLPVHAKGIEGRLSSASADELDAYPM